MTVLEPGHPRGSERKAHERRTRRHRRILDGSAALAVGLVALLAFMTARVTDPRTTKTSVALAPPPAQHRSGYALASGGQPVRVNFRQPPRAGLLFDVRTGDVLWERDPRRPLPIASLTKMMTALVAVAHSRPADRVLITRAATRFTGSGVGLLPHGKRVPVLPLLYGLLLPSGNDAAIALAQHVARTQAHFVSMMNATGRAMGLRCSHFDTVSGIVDRGNYSCAADLAILAHAMLEQRQLRQIVASSSAILPFPIKGGKLYLYNNNPLMYLGYRGVDGVKTGYTTAAGMCLVASARRGRRWYGVVLLHSVNPASQAERLLNAAFAARRLRPTPTFG